MSAPPLKRARTVSRSRPIDKQLIVINKALALGVQADTNLITATFPCTITGIRWSLGAFGNAGGPSQVYWAIVLIKDGNAISNFATSDAASFYQPEQDVLAFGFGHTADIDAGAGNAQSHWEGSTKTMRKLMGGDSLAVVMISNGSLATFDGIVQFFCKT